MFLRVETPRGATAGGGVSESNSPCHHQAPSGGRQVGPLGLAGWPREGGQGPACNGRLLAQGRLAWAWPPQVGATPPPPTLLAGGLHHQIPKTTKDAQPPELLT